MLVRVFDGSLRPKDKIRLMAAGAEYLCEQVGVFTPKSLPRESISAGEVGFVIAGIKELKHAKVGDTITRSDQPAETALEGFKEIQPQVFAGLYPVESHDYESLRDALEKLKLNDASLKYEPETSQALGFGFRCGFLGLLHLDIIQERLEREFDQDLITTAPTVEYEVVMKDGSVIIVENPSKLPETTKVIEIREPIITATILVPDEYLGNVITLCNLKRGAQVDLARLCLARLRVQRVPCRRPDQARHPRQQREGGRAVAHRPPRIQPIPGSRVGVEDARVDSAPDVRHRRAGRHRQPHHRP
jgi:GTP-binding protein LepA